MCNTDLLLNSLGIRNMKESGLKELFRILRLGNRKRKWKRLHPNSDTLPMNIFNFENVSLGDRSYGELNVVDFGGKNKLIIKNYVSIAQNVTFILNAEHYINHISTYPFKVKILHEVESESFGKGDIVIDDDVWIGYGATIMSGVHIEQGAVIASGTVVTKDVPPYAIVGGVPAKVIKYRFTQDLINELLKLDYSKLTDETIKKNIDDLYQKLTDVKQLEWLPKKYKS